MEKPLKASSKSIPKDLAGAIAGQVNTDGKSVINAIGAGSVNQSIKAIAIARGFLAPSGIDLICTPSFSTIPANPSDINRECTVMTLTVEPR